VKELVAMITSQNQIAQEPFGEYSWITGLVIQAVSLVIFLYLVVETARIRKIISRIESKIDNLSKPERKEETKIY